MRVRAVKRELSSLKCIYMLRVYVPSKKERIPIGKKKYRESDHQLLAVCTISAN